ncbi:MAG: phosphate ABC transporter substrate-binding/OmpA family protein [Pseudomonadota bacterium]|nr:phosphate ABC transporter substrate-binding/OmpA family protein [Pseudomonadota bacterium]
MAQLTPLAKGLITVIILGGTGAAAWHLGLRDLISTPLSREPAPAQPASERAGPEEPGRGAQAPEQETRTDVAGGDLLGSRGNPLKVSLVSFHGYAPALLANGLSLTTKPGSIFAQKGVAVEFILQDDIPTLSTIFESGAAHCAWRTSDFWAQEQPNLRNAGLDGRAIMVVDNTQGGDAVIARDPAIQSIEDLAGKSVALLQYTPSHGMVIDAVENSSLSPRKKQSIDYVYINAEEGTGGVRAAFEGGQVDAAALWDPDLALALKKVPGAHVIYSTRTATNLIYDVIVCDRRHLEKPDNDPVFKSFVAGWMDGVEAAKRKPEQALDALIATEEFFALLVKEQGRAFVLGLFNNLVWTDLKDNARILGLAGDTNHYERVYRRFDGIYRRAGALANPNSPVIAPQDSFDYRFIKGLLAEAPAAKVEAAKPAFTFTEVERTQAAKHEASITKPVMVNFPSGSAALTKRAERTIDEELVPFIENNGSAYFEVSGNTDSTGRRESNLRLSKARAQAVVDYLVGQWEFPRERFVIVGNGPDKPLCDEKRSPAENLSLEECRARNRTTRVAVLAR